MIELRGKAEHSPTVAGLCLAAFLRGGDRDDSATERARARVGGELIARGLQDLRMLRESTPKGPAGG